MTIYRQSVLAVLYLTPMWSRDHHNQPASAPAATAWPHRLRRTGPAAPPGEICQSRWMGSLNRSPNKSSVHRNYIFRNCERLACLGGNRWEMARGPMWRDSGREIRWLSMSALARSAWSQASRMTTGDGGTINRGRVDGAPMHHQGPETPLSTMPTMGRGG